MNEPCLENMRNVRGVSGKCENSDRASSMVTSRPGLRVCVSVCVSVCV